MKKSLLTGILASATALTLSAQVQQKVLIEEFTGAWCGYCPDGALIVEDITATNPDVIAVSVHNSDAMVTSTGNIVEGFFNNLGFPSATLNRSDESQSRSLWASQATAMSSGMSDVGVSFDSWSYNATTRVATITVRVESFGTKSGNHRLGLIVTEDKVTGSGSAFDQANYYNTTVGSPLYGLGNPIIGYEHNHVARAYVGTAWGGAGVVADNLYPGYVTTYTFTTTLVSTWDPNEMHVVAYVANYDGSGVTQRSIINSETMPMSVVTGVSDAVQSGNISLTAAPNPFNDRTTASFSINETAQGTVEVLNTVGQRVALLSEGVLTAGTHSETWIASGVPAGIYMIRVSTAAGESQTEKVMVTE